MSAWLGSWAEPAPVASEQRFPAYAGEQQSEVPMPHSKLCGASKERVDRKDVVVQHAAALLGVEVGHEVEKELLP